MFPIVRRGHVAVRRRESPAVNLHGRRRPASAATAQALQTVAALLSRHSGRNVMLRLSTATAPALPTVAALSRRHARRNVMLRLSTATAAAPPRDSTIPSPHPRPHLTLLLPRPP